MNNPQSGLFLPWHEVMRAGFGVLRLSSDQFWAMTPRELEAALQGVYGAPSSLTSPAKRDLLNLMKRYPDEQTNKKRD